MVVLRFPSTSQAVKGQLRFEGEQLSLQERIKILGVTVNRELRYDTHITPVAQKTSQPVSALRIHGASSLSTRYKSVPVWTRVP